MPRPSGRAATATVAPTIDGDVLGDAAWAAAVPMSGFWQEQPFEGQPSTERTEVRFVVTADTLFVGVVCYDSDPSGIIVSDARRDAPLDETDSFRLILDTYRDRQNGFVFGTNPAGIEYDGQVTNEGQGGGGLSNAQMQMGGSGSGFNLNWDGAWQVRARISDVGWSAEFAIPFKTLRYPAGQEQVWGVNFQRNIRRRNERSFWAPIPRQFTITRVSLAGTVELTRVPAFRNLKLIPYVLGNVLASGEVPVKTNWLGDAGLDMKYNLTPSLTLDATVNTDFAQVEVDDQQVNLDRFNLFFPEKRPVLPRERGVLRRRQSRRGGPVLQPPDRHRPRRQADPDSRRRACLGQGRRLERRPAEHADRQRRSDRLAVGRAEQQLRGHPPQSRVAQPLAARRALHQSRGLRRLRAARTTPVARTRSTAGGGSGCRRSSPGSSPRPRATARRPIPPSTSARAPTRGAPISTSATSRSATTSTPRSAS